MLVAGIHISDQAVAELIVRLRDEYYFKAAETLDRARAQEAAAVGLTIRERTAVLDVLDDPPASLEQLRAVLDAEHASRLHHRLTPAVRL
jgi:hypothetical protein